MHKFRVPFSFSESYQLPFLTHPQALHTLFKSENLIYVIFPDFECSVSENVFHFLNVRIPV
jgi:hypothetical protein